jgi:plasmid stabilization system protein ParE
MDPNQADNYPDELFHGMELLLENPKLGKFYPHFENPYRKLHINGHHFFFTKRIKANVS